MSTWRIFIKKLQQDRPSLDHFNVGLLLCIVWDRFNSLVYWERDLRNWVPSQTYPTVPAKWRGLWESKSNTWPAWQLKAERFISTIAFVSCVRWFDASRFLLTNASVKSLSRGKTEEEKKQCTELLVFSLKAMERRIKVSTCIKIFYYSMHFSASII